MGGKDPSRQPMLKGTRLTPVGYARMLKCTKCGHLGPFPSAALIRKYGPDFLVEFAVVSVKCSECGEYGGEHKLMKLCEPGCAKQRG